MAEQGRPDDPALLRHDLINDGKAGYGGAANSAWYAWSRMREAYYLQDWDLSHLDEWAAFEEAHLPSQKLELIDCKTRAIRSILNGTSNEFAHIYFPYARFKGYLISFHIRLIGMLSDFTGQSNEVAVRYEYPYLTIDGSKLLVNKGKQADLCKALFSSELEGDPYQPVDNDILFEAAGYREGEVPHQSGSGGSGRWFYRASDDLNKRILEMCGIPDFFLTAGTTQVCLNPKYRPKT